MLGQRYRNLVPFGKGSQSEVWKSVDTVTGQSCIIKSGPHVHSEAVLSLDLNHPFVVAPFDAGTDEAIGDFAVYPEIRQDSLLQVLSANSNKHELQRITLQV